MVKRSRVYIVVAGLFLVFTACSKVKYYPDSSNDFERTKILGHRGYGAFHSQYQENTFLAAQQGLLEMDGVEVDIQISKDGTIWLAHNAPLPDCNGHSSKCFPETQDKDIEKLDSCLGPDFVFSRLEPIFELIANRYPDKVISLDVKAWAPCGFESSDILGMLNLIGEKIIGLGTKYGVSKNIMVESETASFLKFVKKRSDDIETYLVSFGDFERAMQLCLEAEFDGIAFQYKEKEEIGLEEIELIRNKGLKIQLWTVNDTNHIREALAIKPDYIQSDNLKYFK
jgi:glycerophosphoryl diester phosphodiesterase